jgi:hypothetical protein
MSSRACRVCSDFWSRVLLPSLSTTLCWAKTKHEISRCQQSDAKFFRARHVRGASRARRALRRRARRRVGARARIVAGMRMRECDCGFSRRCSAIVDSRARFAPLRRDTDRARRRPRRRMRHDRSGRRKKLSRQAPISCIAPSEMRKVRELGSADRSVAPRSIDRSRCDRGARGPSDRTRRRADAGACATPVAASENETGRSRGRSETSSTPRRARQ